MQPDSRDPRPPAAQPPLRTAAACAAARRPRWTSAELFAGAEEIEIQHGEAVYRMRITSLGKLILTK